MKSDQNPKITDGRKNVSQGVSFDPALLEKAKQRADELSMSFSEYVTRCLKRDIAKGGEFVIVPEKGEKW